MKKVTTYTEAYEKLEELVSELEDGDIPLDRLAEKIKEANGYINLCEKKLRQIELEVNAIQEENGIKSRSKKKE
jgi:exodeoxyribonuclease VII small subunit